MIATVVITVFKSQQHNFYGEQNAAGYRRDPSGCSSSRVRV